jgi:hypothetical protein
MNGPLVNIEDVSITSRTIISNPNDFAIKHYQKILIYSAYGRGFGNSKPPTKGESLQSKWERRFPTAEDCLDPFIEVDLII